MTVTASEGVNGRRIVADVDDLATVTPASIAVVEAASQAVVGLLDERINTLVEQAAAASRNAAAEVAAEVARQAVPALVEALLEQHDADRSGDAARFALDAVREVLPEVVNADDDGDDCTYEAVVHRDEHGRISKVVYHRRC